jgi:cell division protein FtsL
MDTTLIIIFGSITFMTVAPIAIIFGYLHFKGRAVSKQELRMLQNDISKIKSDIEDIKEQIADFIIKTN